MLKAFIWQAFKWEKFSFFFCFLLRFCFQFIFLAHPLPWKFDNFFRKKLFKIEKFSFCFTKEITPTESANEEKN